MDTISVIIPVYRTEDTLDRCVTSVVNQTYPQLEILLIDDGSPDRCPILCDGWAERDARIKVIHKENGGVSSARNAGLRAATGEYIAFVDSDDTLPEYALQLLYDRIVQDGSEAAVGKHIDLCEDGSTNGAYCDWMTDQVLSKDEFFHVMGQPRHFPVAVWGKLYRKHLFEGVEYPPLVYGEDLWLFPLLFDRSKVVSVVGETVYFYHRRNSSVTHHKSEQTRYEELTAILHMASCLLSRGFADGAGVWLRTAVDKAAEMNRKQKGVRVIKQWLDGTQQQNLFALCPVRTRIKWLLLQIPVLFNAVRLLKRLVRSE